MPDIKNVADKANVNLENWKIACIFAPRNKNKDGRERHHDSSGACRSIAE